VAFCFAFRSAWITIPVGNIWNVLIIPSVLYKRQLQFTNMMLMPTDDYFVRWALLLLWTSTCADQSPLAQSMTKGEYAAFEKRDTSSRISHEFTYPT
jgi:hypothetical protein